MPSTEVLPLSNPVPPPPERSSSSASSDSSSSCESDWAAAADKRLLDSGLDPQDSYLARRVYAAAIYEYISRQQAKWEKRMGIDRNSPNWEIEAASHGPRVRRRRRDPPPITPLG